MKDRKKEQTPRVPPVNIRAKDVLNPISADKALDGEVVEECLITSEFKSCNLGDADLRGTDLESAVFTNSMLRRTDLSRAKLRGTDLRGADIEGATIRPKDLKGAIVNVAQAMDLARLLGLIIQ
jgi:uncharacterized protein YjbI with pentapeptide repeats